MEKNVEFYYERVEEMPFARKLTTDETRQLAIMLLNAYEAGKYVEACKIIDKA